jgi:membrane protein DedA with SNARE-associated domain
MYCILFYLNWEGGDIWEPMQIELEYLAAYIIVLLIANIIANQIFWSQRPKTEIRKGQ